MDPSAPPSGRWPPRRLERSRLFLFLVVILVVLGTAVGLGARPAYRAVKQLRARRAAAAGELALKAGDPEAAARQARLALGLAPEDPEVLRLAGRVSARGVQPEALRYFQGFLARGTPTWAERLEVAECAVRLGRVDVARVLLDALVRENPGDRGLWRLRIRVARMIGDRAGVVSVARAVTDRFPGDREAERDLGEALLVTGDATAREEGRRILWGVAGTGGTDGERAVEVLLGAGLLQPPEADTLSRLIPRTGTNALRGGLLHGRLQLAAHPDRRAEILARTTQLVPTNGPVPEVSLLVMWLSEVNGLEAARAHLPRERCRTNLLLMAAQLDCLVETGREAELREVLAEPDSVLDAGMRAAAEGALLARQGQREAAERAFEAALEGGSTRLLLVAPFVAREAERHGLVRPAVKAWRAVMQVPGRGLEAGRRVLRLLDASPDQMEALEILRQLNAQLPGEDGIVLERAWLEAVVGQNLDWALDEARRLMALRPKDPSVRAVLALALLRSGKPGDALTVIEEPGMDLETAPMRLRVSYVAILGANGQREAARRLARTLPQGGMRQQVEALVSPWR